MSRYVFIAGIILTILGVLFGIYSAIAENFSTGSMVSVYQYYVYATYVAMFVGTVFIVLGLFMNWDTKEVELRKPIKAVITKPTFVLLIMIVNGLSTYSGSLVNYFIHNQSMAVATSVFLGVVFNALVTYFSTEEQTAPQIKNNMQPPTYVDTSNASNAFTSTIITYNFKTKMS